ncbi:Cyclic phosphodiesterase [Linum perenne]
MKFADDENKHVYSVWVAPSDDVRDRLKKLMDGLRSEFSSPEFQTEQDALNKFKSAFQVNFCFQVVEANSHCSSGISSTRIPLVTYMPHLSLLYGDLNEKEKAAAQEKAVQLHDSINSLSFLISCLELWKTDTRYIVLCT